MPIYTHFKAVWASASVLKFGGLNPGVENGPVVKATYNVVLPLTSLLRRPPLYEVTHFFTLVTNRFIIISGLRSDHDKEEFLLPVALAKPRYSRSTIISFPLKNQLGSHYNFYIGRQQVIKALIVQRAT
ncbi:hypothetical protein PCANC_08410 [Puccinia coronata f. sp. avenae]|uniref:Uncharacterized protein n=1 Tax=Puccinia coronata f. sp. avenae TaxID=200324 RepID=A0A2N5T5S1_9BASI|nr:hypothetical protein PCANC_08227 [Puccinia coronata f. sp. avenae]PLW51984.1 hypothetical protein PCANC_08410 [Puccinia coronata f. sp. avenae]